MGAEESELEPLLVFCNSTCFLCIALLRDGSFWLIRVFPIGDLGVGSKNFSIITSLASRGVMVLPGFFFVVGSCGGDISIVGSI